ncbi:MAG: TetR/AcrR family transcriptional regulator [Deltaproteobacteria bacterium]|nr:TetR/AcrR family transcriptional regulator [Deltaproteobacteria bacterium]
MGKNRLAGPERRRQILEKAQKLCAKKGFAGTTLDEIAREAGVSRALIVQHFGNKTGLYEALVDFLFKNHPMEDDPELVECIKERDDFGVFRAFSAHAFKHMVNDRENSPLRLIFFSILENPHLYERHYQQRRIKGVSVLEEYISKRIEEGIFIEVNPYHVAVGFGAMLSQLLLQEVAVKDISDRNTFMSTIETMIQLLLNGLKK